MKALKVPSGLRVSSGHFHYRIKHQGKEYTGNTGLEATRQNVSAAQDKLSEKREQIKNGQPDRRNISAKKFNDAAEEFLRWKEGEHQDHPGTTQRLRTSFVSLKQFFANAPVHSISASTVENYKTWRRLECKVQEVTIRHDLHALSPFFEYAKKENWCRLNPVKEVKIPSGGNAVRDHVVTAEEEKAYFSTALSKFELTDEKGKKHKHGPFKALHDIARIILDQGMRPDEVMSLRVDDLDLGKGKLKVIKGKSKAARRTLSISAAVKGILEARVGERTEGWVFQGKKAGTHLTKPNNAHDAVLKKIGASFVPYEFRHTFATRFGETIGRPFDLAAILGHADLKTVLKYCHVREAHTAKAMEEYNRTQAEQK